MEKEIRNAISSFSGNLLAAYNLAEYLNEKYSLDLDFNFNSSNSVSKFTNIIRNMISRSVIQRPTKAGRSLILSEREFLQIAVARKYLLSGCSLDSLTGYLVDMPTDAIYDRLFSETQLPDIHKLTKKLSDSTQRSRSNVSRSELGEPNPRLYHHVKVDTGLFLLAKAGEYEEVEVMEMVVLLNNHLKERAKRQPKEDDAPTGDNSYSYENFD